ncbi:MAG TPA: universal stress protein [Candidatus Limnocylindrales bacterium]|nr:universal stress protein [Candidatus Limnocylindrales bacterium]
MKNKVLVAIDSTGLSELVVDVLAAQLRPEETEVLVLEVAEPLVYSVPPEMSPGYTPELVERRKKGQEQAKETLGYAVEVFRNSGFQADSRLVESEIKEGILNVAAEWGATLIVVTSHARSGVAKFLHRSIAEAIVHRAPCSVLVLKEPAAEAAA